MSKTLKNVQALQELTNAIDGVSLNINTSQGDTNTNAITANTNALPLKLDKTAITASTLAPSGGVDGDIWFVYV